MPPLRCLETPVRKTREPDFEAECRARFRLYCELYREAKFHSLKKQYAAKAYDAIEDYLDHRDIQSL